MKHTTQNCSDLLLQAKELEAEFIASLSERGVLNASVRNLCSNIRHLYESIILADPAFAEVQNVEHSLWQLHYRQIEDFRHHVFSVKEWVVIRDNSARSTFTKEKWIELLQSQPVLAGFTSFLTEVSGFYHELILKLKANSGVAPNWESKHHQKSKSVEFNRCQQSCYRCLVNLGDYARYKEFYVGNDPFSYDFSIAADFYREAIAHWPLGGQPHNQLAVLAVYVKDELLAVYHYFRSLAVEKPFPTTRENLTILFEKNRVKYEGLPPSPMKLAMTSSISKRPEKMNHSQITKSTRKVSAKKTGMELIGQFFVRFVRLNGLFFTKTSLEKFEEVYAGVVYDLQQLLALDDRNLELTLGCGSCFGMPCELHGSFRVLKLVVILICTLENVIFWSKRTEASMQKVLFQNACKALLTIVGHLMQRCAEAQHASDSPLLPAILVFLEWLACRPDIVRGVEKEDEQFNFLSIIWKHFLRLSDCFYKEARFRKVMHDWQEKSKLGVTLWEDFELQGFLPLSPGDSVIVNGDRSKCKDKDFTEDGLFRWHRFVASGNALARIADGSSLGAIFGQGVAEVYKSEENCDNGVVEKNICRQVKIKEDSTSSYGSQVCGCDDNEEEELIVFQPTAKDHLVLPSGGTTAVELLNHLGSSIQNATSSCEPTLTCTSSSISSSYASKLLESPNPECLPNPSSLYAADTTKSDAISSHSLDPRRLTAPAEQPNKIDPISNSKHVSMALFEQLSGYRRMEPFITSDIAFELRSYMGSRRGVNSLGVIGQPKLIQSRVQEIVKGSNGVHNDLSQLEVVSFTGHQQPPSSLFKENFRNDCQGNSPSGTIAKLVGSPQPFCQTSSFPSTKIIRPPPGFGPQPTRLPMSGKFKHLHGGKELFGNNCPVKETMHSNFAPVLGENLNPPPGYSLWSAVSNKIPQAGSEIQPSLSSSPLLPHPSSTVAQQPFQIAKEKEMWSLFGSEGGYNWTPTIIS